jgi:multidrug efflux pump subunit AcrA (membrane-fusion protein)
MRTVLIAFGLSLALAACGGAASPGQPAPAAPTTPAQTTPAQQTPLPSATPAQGGYEGY